MLTFLITLFAFAIILGVMALGVMLTGRRLQGSCGGVAGDACRCSPERQARCKDKHNGDLTPHADVPIAPGQLTRPER